MPLAQHSRDTWRFPTALALAIAAHALIGLTWQNLPFARASEQSPVRDNGLASLAVQLVAPPAPVAPQPVLPEPEPPPPPPPPRIETPPPKPEPEPVPIPEPPAPVSPAPVIASSHQDAPKVAAVEKPPPRSSPESRPAPVAKPAAPQPLLPREQPQRPATSTLITGPPAPPSYQFNPKPSYPADARRAHAEGTTYLRVEVQASGAVGRVTVIKSSGHGSLDAAAAQTVASRWRFHPARRGGVAVPAVVTVPIRFELR